MKKIGCAGLSTMLCLAFALPALAQQPSAAELACNKKYGDFYNKQDDVPLFDTFVKDATCKDSMYREGAYQIIAQKLVAASKWKEAMDIANRFGAEVPNASTAGKVYVYSQGLTAASQTGDVDKIIEMGEKVLSVDANNLNAIVIVATTIPEKLPTDPAPKDKALARALELAKKLLAMTRPEALPDATWQTAVIGPAHSVIGFVHLQRSENAEAAAEYEQAVKINAKDQMSWYRMSLASTYISTAAGKLVQPAYDEINTDENRVPGPGRDAALAKAHAIEADYAVKRDKALDSFLSAVALGGPIATAAKTTLDQLWQAAHDKTTVGLDDAIAKRKAELK